MFLKYDGYQINNNYCKRVVDYCKRLGELDLGELVEDTKDITFMELIVLEKMEKNTIIDSFGSQINSSFFDTAGLMGTLQVKNLIKIKPTVGRSIADRTELGEKILAEATKKSKESIDELDHAILRTTASGARTFGGLLSELNIRGGDLSYHLYKLVQQGYIDYIIRNIEVFISLTEAGFKLTGFVPKKVIKKVEISSEPEEKQLKLGIEEKKPGIKTEETDVEKVIKSGEDITSKMLPYMGEKVQLTKWYKMKNKAIYYLKKYGGIIFVFIAVALIIIIAKFLGFI